VRSRVYLIPALALALISGAAAADPSRWDALPEQARVTIALRREVGAMVREGRLRIANPEVAQQLTGELTRSLGRPVAIPRSRIVQVEWGSAEHQALRRALAGTIGLGMYPSKSWGHTKLRLGDQIADSVPGYAQPFPSTGSRARLVPADGMHGRYYEAVFAADPTALRNSLDRAGALVADKRSCGMNCATFVSQLLRGYVEDAGTRGGKLGSLWWAGSASQLWNQAMGSDPALVVVYTPRGDFRDIRHPDFKFDYILP
jgi:hypothetical protein